MYACANGRYRFRVEAAVLDVCLYTNGRYRFRVEAPVLDVCHYTDGRYRFRVEAAVLDVCRYEDSRYRFRVEASVPIGSRYADGRYRFRVKLNIKFTMQSRQLVAGKAYVNNIKYTSFTILAGGQEYEHNTYSNSKQTSPFIVSVGRYRFRDGLEMVGIGSEWW